LSRLVLNHDSPDLCCLSSKDYRCEPPVPSQLKFINDNYYKTLALMMSQF
jgi:hypothetical protein